LIPPQRVPLLPLSFTPNLITVILSTTVYLSIRLPASQLIQNSLARAVDKALKSCHITPVLRSLHWLKITERIEYKLFSLTYKVLTTNQPPYLYHLISAQPQCSTRSSSLVIIARPPTSFSLRITDRSFRYASPCLWNQLPSPLRQLHFSPSLSVLPVHAPIPHLLTLSIPHSHQP